MNDDKCGHGVYWWNGEYDGTCELPKGHLEPFLFLSRDYDGISYFDDDSNNCNHEQEKLKAYISKNYYTKEQILELIGEDDKSYHPYLAVGIKDMEKNQQQARIQQMRANKLRQELRTKLEKL